MGLGAKKNSNYQKESEIMRSAELIELITKCEDEQGALLWKVKELQTQICSYKSDLLKAIKQERQEKEDSFLKSLGICDNCMFVIFNKKAEFIKSIDPYKEFSKFDEFINWLKKEKVYAHAASSFNARHLQWYDLTLAEQLKNLGWEFDNNGYVKNTDW